MPHIKRFLHKNILLSLKEWPAVYLNGPRQVGKSTLAQEIAQEIQGDYLSLDDVRLLSSAQHDPISFISRFDRPVVLDEAQLAPELFRAIKQHIDQRRSQHKATSFGRFLLTGSTNIMALPQLADALVGRMQTLTLLPLSVEEALKKPLKQFIDQLFSRQTFTFRTFTSKKAMDSFIQAATFPELVVEKHINRSAWFNSYINTLIQRDIQQLAQVEKANILPLMLKLLATHVGGLLNDADLARDCGLNMMTYRRYRTLFEHIFLINLIPPWFNNIGKRLVKSPKIYFNDTELLLHLLPYQKLSLLQNEQPRLYGAVVENFVASELAKKITLTTGIQLFHFRTHDNHEIDFILENSQGEIVAIEVKARETVMASDFKTIALLQEKAGKSFIKGVVLYLGDKILSFGKDCYALPLASLWEEGV
ncbi:MAG: ATP-binding protein [Gammaproteobacteria bacterium]|nr:ATP-binding protein [Gammaproteobacteria bacterium]